MEKFQQRSFKRFFAVLLISELVTVLMAALLLNLGVRLWIHRKAKWLLNIAVTVAGQYNWSHVDQIRNGKFNPAVYSKYRKDILESEADYFPGLRGNIEIYKVEDGEEYALISDDPNPSVVDEGKAEPIDLELYSTDKPSYTPSPPQGRYAADLEADAPIMKKGAIVAFVSATTDASPVEDFRGIVRTAYWLSILPAFVVSVLVAFFLAGRFVEPMQFLRQVQEARQTPATSLGSPHALLGSLSPREREVAFCVGQGLENKEIAEKLSISQETVKKHLKNIFQKLEISSRISLVLIAIKEFKAGSPS